MSDRERSPASEITTQIIESLASAGVQVVAAVLDGIAERTISPEEKKAYLRSSRALCQNPGRPSKDDRLLLQEVDYLLASGIAKSEHRAIVRVASTVAKDSAELHAVVERLRRKRRINLPT